MTRKVAITIPCLTLGGTEMQTLGLIGHLRSCGFVVDVICYFGFTKSIVEEFQASGANIRLMALDRGLSFIRFIYLLKREIQNIRPDIVHVQYMSPGALPIIAARLAGVKTVLATVHQPHTLSHGILSKLILRTSALLTSKFIAVSQNAERSWFGTSALFDENKPPRFQPHHFTIHNSVDTHKIQEIIQCLDREALKSQLSIPIKIPLLGTVSRLRHEKGVDVLVRSFNLLIKEGIDAHLLIVGSGPDETKLREETATLGISDHITYYGMADWKSAIRLLSIMDIVIVPSHYEGFGLAAVEAMAAEKPLIVSDTSGLREIIVNRETGLTFASQNSIELTRMIKLLLNEPELCRKYGVEGRMRAISLFDKSVFNKKIAVLYNAFGH